MRSAAPPRRRCQAELSLPSGEPRRPVRDEVDLALGVSASWLVVVMAARGGLDGGDGSPVEGTSGIPLGPCETRSAVVKALQGRGGRVGHVAAGEDIGLTDNVLAIITTGVIGFR